MPRIRVIGSLIGLGAISTALAYFLDSTILVFAGLGLIAWGTSLFFMSSTKRVDAALLLPQMRSTMVTLDDFLQKVNVAKSVFYPSVAPFTQPPVQKLLKGDPGSTLTLLPTGLDLLALLENRSKADFSTIDFDTLQEVLPPVFADELGLSTGFEMRQDGDVIRVTLRNYVLHELCVDLHSINPDLCTRTPCPVLSAIACSLVKTLRRPVSIDTSVIRGDTIEVAFQVS